MLALQRFSDGPSGVVPDDEGPYVLFAEALALYSQGQSKIQRLASEKSSGEDRNQEMTRMLDLLQDTAAGLEGEVASLKQLVATLQEVPSGPR